MLLNFSDVLILMKIQRFVYIVKYQIEIDRNFLNSTRNILFNGLFSIIHISQTTDRTRMYTVLLEELSNCSENEDMSKVWTIINNFKYIK